MSDVSVSVKMVKVLLCSITAGKVRVKYVPKQVQGAEGRTEEVIGEAGSETIVFSRTVKLTQLPMKLYI